jgi:hypothetical protein
VLSGRRLSTFQRCLLPTSSGRPDKGGLVHETKVDRRPVLLCRIFSAAEYVRSHPETIPEATQSILMHAEKCIESQGGQFQQFLWFYFVYSMLWLLINV